MIVREAKGKGAFNLVKKILLTCLLIIFTNLNARPATKIALCADRSTCSTNLANHPLFDTEYKMAANYVPILALRGMAHADVYKAKKTFSLDRRFYMKDSTGKFNEPYEKIYLNCSVVGSGIIGREINCEGMLNEYVLKYQNIMKFSLPKRAHMEVKSTLDGVSMLNLSVYSDGDKLTNNVQGVFLGKTVNYQTLWRDSKGMLSGSNYQINTVGSTDGPDSFRVITKGKIGNSVITGEGKIIGTNNYEFVEYYGPVMVKTILTVL